MNRFLLGIGLGAALAYFYDQQRGDERRARFGEWINQYVNADTVESARQATQATIGQARNLTNNLTNQVSDQMNQLRSGRRSTTTTTTTTTGTANSAKSSAGAQI